MLEPAIVEQIEGVFTIAIVEQRNGRLATWGRAVRPEVEMVVPGGIDDGETIASGHRKDEGFKAVLTIIPTHGTHDHPGPCYVGCLTRRSNLEA